MGKLSLTFTSSVAILSFVIGKFPDWVAKNIIEPNSKFTYILHSDLKYDALALLIIIALIPPIIWCIRLFILTTSKAAFHIAILISHHRRMMACALTIAFGVAFLSFGLLAQAAAAYVFVVAREYSWHTEINRQRLIETANNVGETNGVLASIRILQRIITLYPDDEERNENLKAYITNVENYKNSSDQLTASGVAFAKAKRHYLAVKFYKAALGTFPYNKDASSRLEAYRRSFQESKPNIAKFFSLCRDKDLMGILASIEDYTFSVKETQSVKRLRVNMDGDDGNRIYLQLCSDPLRHENLTDYSAALENRIFGND